MALVDYHHQASSCLSKLRGARKPGLDCNGVSAEAFQRTCEEGMMLTAPTLGHCIQLLSDQNHLTS